MVRLHSSICRGSSLCRASSCTQLIFVLITIGALCLLAILFQKPTLVRSSSTVVPSTLNHIDPSNDFTCLTSKTFPSLDTEKYEQCLRWTRDERFWSVQHVRHTAFAKLLNSSSLIVEVGGNIGYDTDRFITLYNASIITFEPLIPTWKGLKERFKSNPKVDVRPYALGKRAKNLSIELRGNENDGTSIFRKLSPGSKTKIEQIQVISIIETIENIRKTRTENGIIDMISINCEGCEFEIIPALIASNMLQYFRIVQFSTHTGLIVETSCIYCQIQQALERTHRSIYHYRLLWEAWTVRSSAKN